MNISFLSFFYSPTDAQVNCLKNNIKIYNKIDIITAPTCFGGVTPSSGSALLVLAEVTVVNIAILATVTLASMDNALPEDGVTALKHVRAVLMSILM
jgi:hypothetical protein